VPASILILYVKIITGPPDVCTNFSSPKLHGAFFRVLPRIGAFTVKNAKKRFTFFTGNGPILGKTRFSAGAKWQVF
jgi:hypothetical protein